MKQHEVYLGLGGNIGNSLSILQSALKDIQKLGVADLKVSNFYETEPVSDIPQRTYINAVCQFKTILTPNNLLLKLQQIEAAHGKIAKPKIAKPKNAPRLIDIDILFFGHERHNDPQCEIPHPRWKERLFVIRPLLDLTDTIIVPGFTQTDPDECINLIELIQTFPNHESCRGII